MRPPPRALLRLVPSLPLFVGLAGFARAVADRSALLNDPDTYLHIAAGRWMLAHGSLPLADPFSHTMPGAPWLASEWLGELTMALTYAVGGWSGVAALAAAAFALALALLTRFLLRRLDPLPALIGAVAAMALLLPHLLARPHILALPLLVWWSGALLAARDAGRGPPFRLLAVMLLWANLHASFMFGLALTGFLAAEAAWQPGPGRSRSAEMRRWGCFVAAAIVVALVTPNGVAGLVQPFRLATMPALHASFIEWLPPDLGRFPALEAWLFGLIALGFWLRARLPLPRLLLLLLLLHMALRHARHADLLAVVAPLAVAAALGPALAACLPASGISGLGRALARLARPAGLAAVAATLVLAAVLAAPLFVFPIRRGNDAVTPASAIAAAKRLGLAAGDHSSKLFNGESFGGYLAFAGIPVFIDGRAEMYGNDFLANYVAAEGGDRAALPALLAQYRVGWTLLPPSVGAVAALDRMADWHRVYADEWAVIHVRDAAP